MRNKIQYYFALLSANIHVFNKETVFGALQEQIISTKKVKKQVSDVELPHLPTKNRKPPLRALKKSH